MKTYTVGNDIIPSNTGLVVYKTEYFDIIETNVDNRKTPIFYIYNNLTCLGEIKWYGAWRKFCFFPVQRQDYYTVWDTKCLKVLIDFIDAYNNEWKEKSKTLKVNTNKVGDNK